VKLHNGSKFTLHMHRMRLMFFHPTELPKSYSIRKNAAEIDPGQDYQTELQFRFPRTPWIRGHTGIATIQKKMRSTSSTSRAMQRCPLRRFRFMYRWNTRVTRRTFRSSSRASSDVLTPFLDDKGMEQNARWRWRRNIL